MHLLRLGVRAPVPNLAMVQPIGATSFAGRPLKCPTGLAGVDALSAFQDPPHCLLQAVENKPAIQCRLEAYSWAKMHGMCWESARLAVKAATTRYNMLCGF